MMRELGRLIQEGHIPAARLPQLLEEMKAFFVETDGVDETQARACTQMLYLHLLADNLQDLVKLRHAIPFYEEFLANMKQYTGWSPEDVV